MDHESSPEQTAAAHTSSEAIRTARQLLALLVLLRQPGVPTKAHLTAVRAAWIELANQSYQLVNAMFSDVDGVQIGFCLKRCRNFKVKCSRFRRSSYIEGIAAAAKDLHRRLWIRTNVQQWQQGKGWTPPTLGQVMTLQSSWDSLQLEVRSNFRYFPTNHESLVKRILLDEVLLAATLERSRAKTRDGSGRSAKTNDVREPKDTIQARLTPMEANIVRVLKESPSCSSLNFMPLVKAAA